MSQHHKSTRRMNMLRDQFRADCAAADAACWLCGQEIPYDVPFDDYANDDRFQLDHFYPVSTHPELAEDRANFRASHCGCNRERSDKAPMPTLGTLSRAW